MNAHRLVYTSSLSEPLQDFMKSYRKKSIKIELQYKKSHKKGNPKRYWKMSLENEDILRKSECFKTYYQVTYVPVPELIGFEVLYELYNWTPRQQASFPYT